MAQAKKMGLATATLIGINSMVGAGIFTAPALLAYNVGPAALVTYLCAIVAVACMGLSFARLAQLFPEEGSFYVYTKQWAGHTVGMVAAWVYAIGILTAMGLLAERAGTYLGDYFPDTAPKLLSLLVIAALTVLNLATTQLARASQYVSICCTIFPLLTITVLCLIHGDWENFTPFAPYGWAPALAAGPDIIFGFFGFESIPGIFPLVENAKKNVPRALMIAILGVSAVYFLFIASIFLAIPAGLFSSPGTPLSHPLEELFPQYPWLVSMVHASITLSFISVLNAIIYYMSTLIQSLVLKMNRKISRSMAVIGVSAFITLANLSLKTLGQFFAVVSVFILFSFVSSFITLVKIRAERTVPTFVALGSSLIIFGSAVLRLVMGVLFIVVLVQAPELKAYTNAAAYDPLPLYSSNNPHEFLYTMRKDEKRGLIPDMNHERINFTASFFAQRATHAKDFQDKAVDIGSIRGNWNMFGLLYNRCSNSDFISTLTATPFFLPCTPSCTSPIPTGTFQFGDPNAFVGLENYAFGPTLGKVTVPLEYRKIGARFEAAINIVEDLCLVKAQIGIGDIHQILTPSAFVDLSGTTVGSDTAATAANIQVTSTTLTGTDALRKVTTAFGLDVTNYKKAGMEDLRGQIIFRHAFPVNYGRDDTWPRFLFMPFVQLYGCLGLSERVDPSRVFAVPFGNNGHNSWAFNGGLSFDFEDSLELVVEGGGTYFSSERICNFRVPTHQLQSGIFPCTATVIYKPAPTWHFLATIFARRFIDRLSGHVQFVLLNHFEDCITLCSQTGHNQVCGEPTSTGVTQNLLTCLLAPRTKWDVKQIIIGLNYEISPYMTLGALWQAPLKVHGAPNTNTIVASFIANF